MKLSTSSFYISLALLLSTAPLTQCSDANTLVNIKSFTIYDISETTLIKNIINQINTIDLKLEELAQAVYNNILKVDDRKSFSSSIITYRKYFSGIRKKLQENPSLVSLKGVLDNNRIIITMLNKLHKDGLNTLQAFDEEGAFKRAYELSYNQFTISALYNIYSILNKHAAELNISNFKNSKTTTDQIIAKTENIFNKLNIKQTLVKTAPYAGLATVCIINMDDNNLPDALKSYKRLILRPFKYFSTPAPQVTTELEVTPEVFSAPEASHKDIPLAKVYNTNSSKQKFQKNNNNSAKNNTSIKNNKIEISNKVSNTLNKATQESTNSVKTTNPPAYTNTILGSTYNILNKASIFGIDTRPYFTLSVVGLMAPYIKKDINKLKDIASRYTQKALAYLKNEKYEDGPAKASKVKFNDIIGYNNIKNQLQEPLEFYKNKDRYKALGLTPKRSYILSGDPQLAEEFGKALAGEISTYLEKSKACKVYAVDNAELIKDGLKKIIENNKHNTPLVIILKEVDFLTQTYQEDQEKYSNFIKDLDKVLNDKKSEVIILATVYNDKDISKALTRSDRFSIPLNLDAPTAEERYLFLEKEFLNNGLYAEDFDLNALVNKTENFNFSDLKQLIRKAVYTAHAHQNIVVQDHFNQAL